MTDTTITILKKSTSPKLSYRDEGDLTYYIGHNSSSKIFYFRITANSGGGFFSNEWVSLSDILKTIKAISYIFKSIWVSPIANPTCHILVVF